MSRKFTYELHDVGIKRRIEDDSGLEPARMKLHRKYTEIRRKRRQVLDLEDCFIS